MVEVLRVVRLLHIVVAREETADSGVIHPALHVYQPILMEHLMPTVSASQVDGVQRHRLPAPCVVSRIKDLPAVFVEELTRHGRISFLLASHPFFFFLTAIRRYILIIYFDLSAI